jgi:TatD DNase family protein
MPRYIDVHSHLQFPQYDADREAVQNRLREEEVWTITVGTNYQTSQQALSYAEAHEGVFATVGVHPNEVAKEYFDEKAFAAFLSTPSVVGIGECGLDYYRNDPQDVRIKKDQCEQFEKQIAFAHTYHKPLMLHCRPSKGSMDAYEDVIAILKHFPGATGNVHFFVGDKSIAKEFLELGFTFSFTGVITFARDYDEVIKYIPQTAVLSETDAPFVAPVPHRGMRNEPHHVAHVVEKLALIRSESLEECSRACVENAARVFGLF